MYRNDTPSTRTPPPDIAAIQKIMRDIGIDEKIKKIQINKKRLESWYHGNNGYNTHLAFGIVTKLSIEKELPEESHPDNIQNEVFTHLENLRGKQNQREKVYNFIGNKDIYILDSFLNFIIDNPDLIYTCRIMNIGDYPKINGNKLTKKYHEEISENEKPKVEDDDWLIEDISMSPEGGQFECQAENYITDNNEKGASEAKDSKIELIKNLSSIIQPILENKTDRARFIIDVLNFFYGMKISCFDVDRIGKYF